MTSTVGIASVTLLPLRTEVVIDEKASTIVRYAADEATNFLARILGAPVPVVAKAHRDVTPVWLGDSPAASKAGIDVGSLKRDEFVIRPLGPGVVIAGRDSAAADPFLPDPHKQSRSDKWQPRTERATLFGLYAFLERYAGARFYFPGELGTILPRRDAIEVADGGFSSAPDFTVRRYGYSDGTVPQELLADFGGDLVAFKRENFLRLRMETEVVPCCHGLNKFRYLDRFKETHPEYFSLRADGTRDISCSGHIGHICYSSPIVEVVYQDVKAYLTGQPASSRDLQFWGANTVGEYVDVMSQDGMSPCQCADCQRRYDFSISPNYATEFIWSNTVAMANRLTAEGVKGKLTQMAYSGYRAVPKTVEVPDNVLVMVAEYGPWSLGTPSAFESQTAEIREWTEKLRRKVWLWVYICKAPSMGANFPGIPCVSPRTIGEYYSRVKSYVFGAFNETSAVDRWLYNMLGYYVFSRIAWDNSADVGAIIDEHYHLMYGPAAPEMASFFDSLEEKWVNRVAGRMHDTSKGPKCDAPNDDVLYGEIYSKNVLDDYERLLSASLAKVASGSLEARRIDLMRREMLDPLKANLREYEERKRNLAAFVVKGSKDMEPILLRHLAGKDKKPPMTPDLRTAAKMWISGTDLCIAVDCAEPDMADVACAEVAGEEDVLDGDCIEIDVNAAGDRRKCYTFAINSKGDFADAVFVKKGASLNVSRDFSYTSNCRHEVTRRDDGWTASLVIPLRSLKGWTGSNGFMPANFCRTRRISGDGKGGMNWYVWGPYVKGYHDVQNFGTVDTGKRTKRL